MNTGFELALKKVSGNKEWSYNKTFLNFGKILEGNKKVVYHFIPELLAKVIIKEHNDNLKIMKTLLCMGLNTYYTVKHLQNKLGENK